MTVSRFVAGALVVIALEALMIFGAIMYGRSTTVPAPAPVSMIELAQPDSQISPKWIAIADPNTKTVSLLHAGVGGGNAQLDLIDVKPYHEEKK